jgi:predicted metalloendopeptidase
MRLLSAAARLAFALALCAALSVFAPRAAARTGGALPEPFDTGALDRHADVCANFFAYATGGYRAAHPIPPAYTEYGYIELLVDRTRDIVRGILVRAQNHPGPDGGNAQKIGTFYASCMDSAKIERLGLAPIAPELARIAAIGRPADIPPALAHLHAIGVDAGFALEPAPDIHDSSKIIAEIDQGGIGLPERDYYLRPDPDSRKLRRAYAAHVAKMLLLGGDANATADAQAVLAFETRLARASLPIADLREPEATYHPTTVRALLALAPHARFKRYLRAIDVAPAWINVAEPGFLSAFDRLLTDTPLAGWKSYLRWRLLDTYAVALPARFESANFAFREHTLGGAQTPLPRWKRCVNATNLSLGEAVGAAYVAQTFPAAAKTDALALTLRIKRAYRAEMLALPWMSAATKRIAVGKLDAMGLKVGYPAVWRSYARYAVRPDSYFANVERGQAFERSYELAKIGRPVNRAEWYMTPQTVDAYNDTQRNEIVLPAAQLQRPFYDPAFDAVANLGATGAGTIGHELTHGFDDEGHKFDAHGNLRNWWTARDLELHHQAIRSNRRRGRRSLSRPARFGRGDRRLGRRRYRLSRARSLSRRRAAHAARRLHARAALLPGLRPVMDRRRSSPSGTDPGARGSASAAARPRQSNAGERAGLVRRVSLPEAASARLRDLVVRPSEAGAAAPRSRCAKPPRRRTADRRRNAGSRRAVQTFDDSAGM